MLPGTSPGLRRTRRGFRGAAVSVCHGLRERVDWPSPGKRPVSAGRLPASGRCQPAGYRRAAGVSRPVHTLQGTYTMNLITTLAGSLMEGFLPAGWDLEKIDRLAAVPPTGLASPQTWWHAQFEPFPCASYEDFDTYLGHEIAREIVLAREASRPLALILPVGPMGMYR